MRMHVIVFLVVIPQAALAYPIITEIMPNPDDDCMDCSEWVEILSESHTNITLTTCGKVVNVSLNKGYNVITRNRDKFISIWNISSNIIEAPILLKNSGCEVQLLVNSTHIDISYGSFSDKENISFALLNNTWFICNTPTPGKENLCKLFSFSISLPLLLYVHTRYDDIFNITLFKENCSKIEYLLVTYYAYKENKTIVANNSLNLSIGCYKGKGTGSIEFEDKGNYTICFNVFYKSHNIICRNVTVTGQGVCNLSLSIEGPNIIPVDKKTGYYIALEGNGSAIITYWISDLFGNPLPYHAKRNVSLRGGERVRRDFTAPYIYGSMPYMIFANITHAYCNDIDKNDNNASHLFAVIGEQEKGENFLEIERYDKEARFGDIVDVWINASRNSSKYAVYIWVEGAKRVSEKYIVHLKEAGKVYRVKIPVQIKPNCDNRYRSGVYKLIVEGLGMRREGSLRLSGNNDRLCVKVTRNYGYVRECKKCEDKGMINLRLVEYPQKIYANESIAIKVYIENKYNTTRSVVIYSYLFSNTSRLVSYGWDGNSYKRGWDANKVNVTIPANNWTVVTLKNFINASKGVYTLRIRAIDDNRRIDITKKVRIEQKKEKPRCYISYNNESLNFTQSAACALILNDPEGNVYIYNKNSSHMFNKSGKYTILIINQGTIKRYTVTIPTKKNKYRQGYRDVSGAQVFTFKNIAEMIFIYIASLIRFWMGP